VTDLNTDPVALALLQAMGAAIVDEVGPAVGFALFVDWRDGHGQSYLSNVARGQIVAALSEWLEKTAAHRPDVRIMSTPEVLKRGELGVSISAPTGPSTPLATKCAATAKKMLEEDIDVVLFLFGGEESGSETAWFSSMPTGRALVGAWIANEKRRS
jgi:hypothetical protein